jgi:DNA-directed RNA polymerase specialized sigma24 family protein
MEQQLANLSPEQRQAVMVQAQQEANQRIMQDMLQKMVKTCFTKCAGTSVRIGLGLAYFSSIQ